LQFSFLKILLWPGFTLLLCFNVMAKKLRIKKNSAVFITPLIAAPPKLGGVIMNIPTAGIRFRQIVRLT